MLEVNLKDIVNQLYGRAADYSTWGTDYRFKKSDAELMKTAADLISALNREVSELKGKGINK